MPDKLPHKSLGKKPVKTIKEKRADKKTRNIAENHSDPVARLKKH